MRKSSGRIRGTKVFASIMFSLSLILGTVPGHGIKATEPTGAVENSVSYVGDVDGDGQITPKDVTKLVTTFLLKKQSLITMRALWSSMSMGYL